VLDRERERLRNRFNPSSEDAQGIDPLNEALRVEPATDDLSFLDRLEVTEDMNTAMQAVLFGDTFDQVLTALEEDIALSADPKDGNLPLSELGEVLQFLDSCASRSPPLVQVQVATKKAQHVGTVVWDDGNEQLAASKPFVTQQQRSDSQQQHGKMGGGSVASSAPPHALSGPRSSRLRQTKDDDDDDEDDDDEDDDEDNTFAAQRWFLASLIYY
jgi:hypothetical protein